MRGSFLHYILDRLWLVGQEKAEALEEDGEVVLGPADDALAQFGAGGGRQDNVEGADLSHFFEEFAGGLGRGRRRSSSVGGCARVRAPGSR